MHQYVKNDDEETAFKAMAAANRAAFEADRAAADAVAEDARVAAQLAAQLAAAEDTAAPASLFHDEDFPPRARTVWYPRPH